MTDNGETKNSKRSCLIIIVIILTLILCVLCVGVGYGILKSGSQIFPEELSEKIPDSFSLEPETEAPTENDLPFLDDTLHKQVADNHLIVNQIYAVSNTGETIGQILEIEVTNQSGEDTFFVVPCGTVLLPKDRSQQRMMVIQQASTKVAADEITVLPMYVVCIDANSLTPEAGSNFELGKPIGGKLGEFADCLCGQTLTDDEAIVMGLQFAVWEVAESGELDQVASAGDNALSDIVGSEGMEDFMAMYDMVMQMYGQSAQQWLDQCDIES